MVFLHYLVLFTFTLSFWSSLSVTCSARIGRGLCSSCGGPSTPLRVAFYPYIPDLDDGFTSLIPWLEGQFESLYPCIDLRLSAMDGEAAYNLSQLQAYLEQGTYDVIEIDAVLYGDVVLSGFASEWVWEEVSGRRGYSGTKDDWWPTTLETVRFANKTWGVPHWLCGYFAFARSPTVTEAGDVQALTQALEALTDPKMRVDLGSWDLVASYLVAIAETHGPGAVQDVLRQEVIDQDVAQAFKDFLHTCNQYGCLLNVEDDYLVSFGKGEISSAFGFLESLNTILQYATDKRNISVGWAPYGDSKRSLIFTDVWVKSVHCTGACPSAADAFASFMLQPSTYRYILTSQDVPSKPYRYILPATKSAWYISEIKNDPFYQAVRPDLDLASPIPNYGIPSHRVTFNQALRSALM